MSNYKRFIMYLFQYEHENKQANCGFAKVECRQNVGRMQLHINGEIQRSDTCKVYFFVKREQELPCIFVGDLEAKETDAGYTFACRQTGGSGYDFSEIRGLVIPLTDGKMLASQWDDETYDWSRLRYDMERTDDMRAEPAEDSADLKMQSITGAAAQKKSLLLDDDMAEAPAHADWSQRLVSIYPRVYPFAGDKQVWGMQIQLKDMKYLPPEYQTLGNNSFLLHGFFTYGMLLLGFMEDTKQWFLGIPGIYQNQERVMAALFGFTEFRTRQECVQKTGEFGYWYRFL